MENKNQRHWFIRHVCFMLLALPAFALAGQNETDQAKKLFNIGEYSYFLRCVDDQKGGVNRDDPQIVFYVGYCYANGRGVEADVKQAKAYYQSAAKAGYEPAQKALETLEEIEKAKKDAEDSGAALKELETIREKNRERIRKERDAERIAHEEEITRKDAEIEALKKAGKTDVAEAVKRARDEAEEKYKRQLEQAEKSRQEMEAEYKEQIDTLTKVIEKQKERIRTLERLLAGDVPPPKQRPQHSESQESPLGFSMFAPAQFPSVAADVTGFRLSVFYGRNRNVFGLDIGAMVSVADGDLMGLEVSGLFNQVGSSNGSMQIGGIANNCSGNFLGMQIGGIANCVKGDFAGVQIGTINLASRKMGGFQIGAFNNAEDAAGVQIGVVNHAARMTGVQIGLINLIDNSSCPCLPVFNAHF